MVRPSSATHELLREFSDSSLNASSAQVLLNSPASASSTQVLVSLSDSDSSIHETDWFFLSGMTDLVGWDATLQGGFFDQKSPYTIAAQQVSRVVFRASAGIAVYYHRFGVELENFYLTPEFNGGRSFKYGRIKLVANF
jgi:hypothetical protein